MSDTFGSAGIMPTTPDRRTVVQFDDWQYPSMRGGWFLRRSGDELGRTIPRFQGTLLDAAGVKTRDVVLMPGGTWILNPLKGQSVALLSTYYNDAILRALGGNLAPGMVEVPLHRPPTLLNMSPSADMVAAATGFRKTVPRTAPINGDWSACNLPADLLAYSQPPNASDQLIPLDRVIQYQQTFPENTGYGLAFNASLDWWGTDGFLSFYFGGSAQVVPQGDDVPIGGEFCVQLRGNGTAHLWELEGPPANQSSWKERMVFRWAEPMQVANTLHQITILPIGLNHMVFISRTTETAFDSGSAPLFAALFARGGDPTKNLYIDGPDLTGHTHTFSMTGAGIFRLDTRRNFRTPLIPYRLKFPIDGILFDAPFKIDMVLPAGTPIYVVPEVYKLTGGTVSVDLFSATTGTQCTVNSDGSFASIGGENCYFAKFSFFSSFTHYATPALSSCSFEVRGFFSKTQLAPTIPQQAVVQNMTITGPDVTPDHETCSFTFKDLWNEAQQLQFRDRVPTTVKVIQPSDNTLVGYLFEGITVKPVAEWRGKPDQPMASPFYRAYEPLRLVGMWGVIADKIGVDYLDFHFDTNAPPDPTTGEQPPWKMTDIIRWLLIDAGIPTEEIDIPDNPQRLWPAPKLDKDQYIFQPGLSYARYLEFMSVGLLGQFLVRDRNAGTNGMWRLLNNPQPPYTNILQNFYLQSATNHFATDPTAYGTNGTFARKYRTYPKPPEFNYLAVSAVGDFLPGNKQRSKLSNWWWNPKSFNWPGAPATADPNSPDYTDGMRRPMIINEPKLTTTQEAVDYITRRTSDFAGHGELWAEWTAPNVFVVDPLDTLQTSARPLRINDQVYFPDLNQMVLVRSANPLYKDDYHQWCDFEGKVIL